MKHNSARMIAYTVAAVSLIIPSLTLADINNDVGVGLHADAIVQMQQQNQEQDQQMQTEQNDQSTSGDTNHAEMNIETESSGSTVMPIRYTSHVSATGSMERDTHASDSTHRENNQVMEQTSIQGVSSDADVESFAHAIKQSDSHVANVAIGSSTVSVSYKEPARLFGFIPTDINVTAQADQHGDVTISYPWYRFLFGLSSDSAALHASAEAQAHAATASAVQRESASTTATTTAIDTNASFSAQLKAALLNALHLAFQAQVNTQASSSSGTNQ
jgi:hypothetical protein